MWFLRNHPAVWKKNCKNPVPRKPKSNQKLFWIIFIKYLPSITCIHSNVRSFKTSQFFCISARGTTIAPTTNWVLWSGCRRWQDSRRNIVIIRKVGTLSSFVSNSTLRKSSSPLLLLRIISDSQIIRRFLNEQMIF